MAKICEIDQAEWEAWVDGRPQEVRRLCQVFPPDRLYRMKSTGHRVVICSYSENGTVMVDVLAAYNRLTFERTVFGVKPEDLEECELPGEGEELGALLTEPKAIENFLDEVREQNMKDQQ